ncbi:unnamed protein product, partial [Dibothriocephalus latus]
MEFVTLLPINISQSRVQRGTLLGNTTNASGIFSALAPCLFTRFEFIGYFYIMTIVCLTGIILNLINIVVFSNKCFNATVYYYMLVISITDAVSLIAILPTGLVRCAGHLESCSHPVFRDFRFAMSYYNSYFGFGLANVAEAASAWLTMLVSIERYMAMKHPTIANVYCRHQSGKMHVRTVVLVALAFNSPFFFTMRLSQRVVSTNTNLTSVNRTVLISRLTKFGDSVYYEIYTWIRFLCVQ